MSDLWFNMEKAGYPYMEINLEGAICCYRDTNSVEYLPEGKVRLIGGRGTKIMKLADVGILCLPKKYHRAFLKQFKEEVKEEEVIAISLPRIFDYDDIRFFRQVEKELCADWLLQNSEGVISHSSIKSFMQGWIERPTKPIHLSTHNSILSPNQVWDILIRYNQGNVNIWQLAKEYDIQPAAISKMIHGTTWKAAYLLMEAFKRENGVK